jgi:hypothetical protein
MGPSLALAGDGPFLGQWKKGRRLRRLRQMATQITLGMVREISVIMCNPQIFGNGEDLPPSRKSQRSIRSREGMTKLI